MSRKSSNIRSVEHAFSSSYVAFHGIKTYLAVKNFVAYNGGIALMQDGHIRPLQLVQDVDGLLRRLLDEKKQILGEDDKLESKLYENRYKVAEYSTR